MESSNISLSSILGDRKAMEQERLARLAKKRGAPTKSDPTETAVKRNKVIAEDKKNESSLNAIKPSKQVQATSQISSEPSSGRQRYMDASTNLESSAPATNTSNSSPLQYPYGTIKQTWAFGYPRKNDIKIEEVLRKADLKIALLSSWQIETDWVMSKLDLEKTKLILTYGERDEAAKARHREGAKDWSQQLRLCFPPMGRGIYDCMHSKLMLLFYQDSLRVVVPSANLVRFDWGETGVMQNTVFLIDLPRLPESNRAQRNETLTPFAKELLHFVKAMNADDGITDPKRQLSQGLLNFDYSQTKHVAFVHTIGQTYWGSQDALSTGYPQLAKAVRSIGMYVDPNQPIQIDYTASSIGSLKSERVELMCSALRGINPILPTSTKKIPTAIASDSRIPLHERFRIYYPSDDTVKQSRGGPENGGTLFMAESWSKPAFPSALLRDGISRRQGLLSHSKIILVRSPIGAFVYSGSANFSQNAWGTITWDRDRKQAKLNCPNWECGVLVRARRPEDVPEDEIETSSESETAAAATKLELDSNGVVPMSAFKFILDVPFEVPSRTYGDGVVPWMQPRAGRR